MAQVPPHQRNVHTVFQNYALFPHLNVADNVAFGLRRRKVAKDEAKRRVDEALELVELGGLASRRPQQLSGGQQQRVALARALVLRPAVLLLDEPLGALDAKIRKQLRLELKALQEEVGITFVFVTHDQEEALTHERPRRRDEQRAHRADRHARRPSTRSPATVFVADFLGVSNLMDAEAQPTAAPSTARWRSATSGCAPPAATSTARGAVKIVARPERVQLLEHGDRRGNCLPGMIERTVYVGASLQVMVRLATGAQLQASITNTGDADGFRRVRRSRVHVPRRGALPGARAGPEASTRRRDDPRPRAGTADHQLPDR